MQLEHVVITGAGSFIGFHLANCFHQNGFSVTGTLFNDCSDVAKARIEKLDALGISLKPLDITNEEMLSTFVRNERPDYWIHHAGWAVNYGSVDFDLQQAHLVNTIPLTVLYKSLSETACKGIVVTGTNAEYSDSEQPVLETNICMPDTPYGLSKLSETIRAKQLALQYSLPTRVSRVFIPFGEVDAPQKLIPSVVEALRNRQSIDLSPCGQKRDFLYIDDLAKAYQRLVKDFDRNSLFDIFNICSGEATPLRDLLQKIAKSLHADPSLLKFGARSMRAGEPIISYGSNQKARELLDWNPRPLEEGLVSFLS